MSDCTVPMRTYVDEGRPKVANRKHKRFFDGAGFGCHCWECANSTDWHGEIGKCKQHGIAIGKYDSPNNICSNAGGCGYYTEEEVRDD